MRHRRLRKKIFALREAARVRRLSPAERAILGFAENYVTLQENNTERMRVDEDEDEGNSLVCTSCGEDEHEDDSARCRLCGARLKSAETERRRTDEGRVAGRDDANDLGDDQPKYRGQSTPRHSERVGAGEAIRTFSTNYREASRIPRADFVTGA